MSIDFQFIPVPTDWNSIQSDLKGSCLSVMNTIVLELGQYHQTSRRMSGSYLAQRCKLVERTVRTAVSKLVKLDLIKVELVAYQGRSIKQISLAPRLYKPLQPSAKERQPAAPEVKVETAPPVLAPNPPLESSSPVESSSPPFEPSTSQPAPPPKPQQPVVETRPVNTSLLNNLLEQGVEVYKARQMLQQDEQLAQTILANLGQHKEVRNAAGWLCAEFNRGGYKPKSELSPQQRIKQQHEQASAHRRQEELRCQEARDAQQLRYDQALQHYHTLASAQQEQLHQKARANAGITRHGSDLNCPIFRSLVLELIVQQSAA